MNTMQKLAVFDFDDTLVYGDSLWPFLVYVVGMPRAMMALAEALFLLFRRYLTNKRDPTIVDYRTFIKTHLLRRLLTGQKADNLAAAVAKLRGWQKWNEPVRQTLLDHYNKGHKIVVVSGGLDLYLPVLLADLPQRALICTRMEVKDDVLTGEMSSGNCVRARKAEILANYILKNGPFSESWGYGNYPHDIPMLELVDHRVIV